MDSMRSASSNMSTLSLASDSVRLSRWSRTLSWCPNDDLGAVLESVNLRTITHAAIDRDGAQVSVAKKCLRLLLDLPGKFASRDQDQSLADALRGIEPIQHGQQKCTSLSTTGPRLDHHVAAVLQVGNRPCLYRHQLRPAGTGCSGQLIS